jgi:F0F1-type ATP synthase assembly protein I
MKNNQTPKKKTNNKWLAFINIPIQMGVIIFLFSYGGNWLDEKYPNPHNIGVKILTLLGVAIAFYNINRQLIDINKNS